eukprot:TRINITY_DN1809_c0_g1_i1.p1 TRINITY_DN1809_c0_g1~~TRINITY_DN1809_c0_g1_i1.p1  ORF type:complete len:428 (+),score=179.31 TRINITY_DN1809_c0_g1_i1:107-1390(+)
MITRIGYIGLSGSLRILFAICFLLTEAFSRTIFALIPSFITSFLDYLRAKQGPGIVISPSSFIFRGQSKEEHPTMDMTTPELITFHGYQVEQFVEETKDGYLLTLFRIPNTNSKNKQNKPPILLMHGLLQNSEAWCVLKSGLPYLLADQGYDVWLGNNRGSRYCSFHRTFPVTSTEFWNFSLNQLACFDVPSMIDCILKNTRAEKITYIGFSQGTAQAFAAFSLNPILTNKISLFIALAPAARARGLQEGLLSALVNLAPESIFLLLGHKQVLPITLFWRSILSRLFFVQVIDFSCKYLYGWNLSNTNNQNKMLLYAHLYSYASVKTVVHWFQVIANNRFQMFDDTHDIGNRPYKGYIPAEFPISQLKCPIAIFYGGRDELPDTNWLLNQIKPCFVKQIENYEHLCCIWADDVEKEIFRPIIELLTK